MVYSLNFAPEEKEAVKDFFSNQPQAQTNSKYEEIRWKINNTIITLYTSGKLVIQGQAEEQIKEKLLNEIKIPDELILGIDETGRGENYGSMVFTGVLAYKNKLRELRDSKKTTNLEDKEKIVKANSVEIKTVSFTSKEIDAVRLSGNTINDLTVKAVNEIIEEISKKHSNFKIIIDGNQIKGINSKAEFLPKGDDLNPVIGAASIIAKITRNKSKDKEKRMTWKSHIS